MARQFNKQGNAGAAGAMPWPTTGTRHAQHARQGQDRSTQGSRGKVEERRRRGERKTRRDLNAEATHALDTPCFRWHVLSFSRAHPRGPMPYSTSVLTFLMLLQGCGLHRAVAALARAELKHASGGHSFPSSAEHTTIWPCPTAVACRNFHGAAPS